MRRLVLCLLAVLAFVPTEVAVDMMPMYIGAASIQARESGSWAK